MSSKKINLIALSLMVLSTSAFAQEAKQSPLLKSGGISLHMANPNRTFESRNAADQIDTAALAEIKKIAQTPEGKIVKTFLELASGRTKTLQSVLPDLSKELLKSSIVIDSVKTSGWMTLSTPDKSEGQFFSTFALSYNFICAGLPAKNQEQMLEELNQNFMIYNATATAIAPSMFKIGGSRVDIVEVTVSSKEETQKAFSSAQYKETLLDDHAYLKERFDAVCSSHQKMAASEAARKLQEEENAKKVKEESDKLDQLLDEVGTRDRTDQSQLAM